MRVHSKTIDQNASLDAGYTSPAIYVGDTKDFIIAARWEGTSGSLVGNMLLQGSLISTPEDEDWFSLEMVNVSGDGSNAWNVVDAQYLCVRVVFDRDSGTGDLVRLDYGKKDK
jgi:hypothetical protein